MSSRRLELENNLRAVEREIAPFSPTLIVVTKTYPISDVEILSDLGIDNFGENRSSEGEGKAEAISAHWHYQGEIQSKKLRQISQWAECIHSLDDLGHATKLNRLLTEEGRTISTFIQLSLDGDPARGGLIERDLFELARAIQSLSALNLLGIMCVPPVDADVAEAFAEISTIHQRFRSEFVDSPYLSAGMSGDYLIALHHGATHIRVGSKILGSRQYH